MRGRAQHTVELVASELAYSAGMEFLSRNGGLAASEPPGAGTRLAPVKGMAWNELFRALSYMRSALWIVPLLAILLVLAIAPLVRRLDAWLGWPFAGLSVTGAQALCETMITLSLSFMVITFGSLLVEIGRAHV